MSVELTVKQCLRELREIFPKGHLRAESNAVDADKVDDPDGESTSFARIIISQATLTGAKSFQGLTLDDCMAQVRLWKTNQTTT